MSESLVLNSAYQLVIPAGFIAAGVTGLAMIPIAAFPLLLLYSQSKTDIAIEKEKQKHLTIRVVVLSILLYIAYKKKK